MRERIVCGADAGTRGGCELADGGAGRSSRASAPTARVDGHGGTACRLTSRTSIGPVPAHCLPGVRFGAGSGYVQPAACAVPQALRVRAHVQERGDLTGVRAGNAAGIDSAVDMTIPPATLMWSRACVRWPAVWPCLRENGPPNGRREVDGRVLWKQEASVSCGDHIGRKIPCAIAVTRCPARSDGVLHGVLRASASYAETNNEKLALHNGDTETP